MKIPVPESLFNKAAGLRPATLLKKETLTQVFSSEFCEISKSTFFAEHLWWLFLTKFHDPNRTKMRLTFEWYEYAVAFCVFIYIFFV